MSVQIYYTGVVTTPDGSDFDGYYGEPVEEGTGFTYESGWFSPSWSRTTVYADRDDVTPDTYSPDDGPLIEWLLDRLSERLGPGFVEPNGDHTFYAGEADTDPYTGVSVNMAAHVEGVSPAILSAVIYSIAHDKRVHLAR